MTTGAEVLAPDPIRLRRIHLLQLAQMTVAFGGTGDDPSSDDYMTAGVDECALLLRRHVGEPGDRDEIADAFGQLCEKVATLGDLDADRDGFLNRLCRPQTAEMAAVVRGAVLADREHWLARLAEMAR